nr:isochorismatase family protein [Burkholderia perseverans]
MASVGGRRRHDHVVSKVLPSVFFAAGFDDWLKACGIGTLTVIGYMTQNCNGVEFLADAAGSLSYRNKGPANGWRSCAIRSASRAMTSANLRAHATR